MLKQINVDELLPGMMVTGVLEQSGPMKIRKVGMIRSPDMVKGLKEMGVSLLEVDLGQSLHVEFEEPADLDNENANPNPKASAKATASDINQQNSQYAKYQKNPTTATQKLVATNKQISDVDRQLSQQFHRSLFLPAVDQMPSKWTLYGKPYGYLLAIVCTGLAIGWVGASIPKWWATSNQQIFAERSLRTDASTTGDAASEQSKGLSPKEQTEQNQAQAEKPVNTSNTVPQSTPDNAQTSQAVAQNNTNSQAGVNEQSAPIQNQNQQSQTTQAAQPQPSTQYESVNGVVLEAGQQVLGYQASTGNEQSNDSVNETDNSTGNQRVVNRTIAQNADSLAAQLAQTRSNTNNTSNNDEDGNSVISSAPGFTSLTQPRIGSVNNDLLRRIQRAADEVDRQPEQAQSQAPVKVTDLNSLVRIDQLPPAVLTQMPSMSFSAHMYASNPQDRWVRVNGKRLGEGDYITDALQIRQIESEKVVLLFQDREFTMNALTDW